MMQPVFAPLRKYVQPRDLFTKVNEFTFKTLFNSLKQTQEREFLEKGFCTPICIIVDDVAGSNAIHGGRISPFGHLSIQTPHWNITMLVITQQPTCVSPAFRDNVENIVIFPSEGRLEIEWLKNAYNSLMISKDERKNMEHLKEVVLLAWRGGREDNKEWGLHFLGIQALPRKHSQFYVDFKREIEVDFTHDKKRKMTQQDKPNKRQRMI